MKQPVQVVPLSQIEVFWKPILLSPDFQGIVLEDGVTFEQLVASGLWRYTNLKPGLDLQRDFWKLAVMRPKSGLLFQNLLSEVEKKEEPKKFGTGLMSARVVDSSIPQPGPAPTRISKRIQ